MADKIKVKPEGREGIYLVEPDEICKWINANLVYKPDEDDPDPEEKVYIHCYVGDFPTLIGADWSKQKVIEYLKECDSIGIVIPHQINHAIAGISGSDEKGWTRYLFDIREITEDMLEVQADGKTI